jgi:hypothetical protein
LIDAVHHHQLPAKKKLFARLKKKKNKKKLCGKIYIFFNDDNATARLK